LCPLPRATPPGCAACETRFPVRPESRPPSGSSRRASPRCPSPSTRSGPSPRWATARSPGTTRSPWGTSSAASPTRRSATPSTRRGPPTSASPASCARWRRSRRRRGEGAEPPAPAPHRGPPEPALHVAHHPADLLAVVVPVVVHEVGHGDGDVQERQRGGVLLAHGDEEALRVGAAVVEDHAVAHGDERVRLAAHGAHGAQLAPLLRREEVAGAAAALVALPLARGQVLRAAPLVLLGEGRLEPPGSDAHGHAGHARAARSADMKPRRGSGAACRACLASCFMPKAPRSLPSPSGCTRVAAR